MSRSAPVQHSSLPNRRRVVLITCVLALALGALACSEDDDPAADSAVTDDAVAKEAAPADGPASPSCATLCKKLSGCPLFSAKQCDAACKAAAPGSAQLACLTKGRSCAEATACLQPYFSAGPYVTGNRQIVGPFTLPKTDGD